MDEESSHQSSFSSYSEYHRSERPAETTFEYKLPTLFTLNPTNPRIYREADLPKYQWLPSRLDYPIVPYPEIVQEAYRNGCEPLTSKILPTVLKAIEIIRSDFQQMRCKFNSKPLEMTFSIDDLKNFITLQYLQRGDITNSSVITAAVKMADIDLGTLCPGLKIKPNFKAATSTGLDFVLLIQRVRSIIASNTHADIATGSIITSKRREDGSFLIEGVSQKNRFALGLIGKNFFICHKDSRFFFIGPTSYLDYLFTIGDVLNNLSLMRVSGEYDYCRHLFEILDDSIMNVRPHNKIVTFFKEYESFCLYLSDLRHSSNINWTPVLANFRSLIELSNDLSEEKTTLNRVISLIDKTSDAYNLKNLFERIIHALKDMSPLQLQEVSALHKFLFFAEVDIKAGMDKFVKRTHMKRTVDAENLKQLISFSKREFVFNYYSKHKTMPVIISPAEKATALSAWMRSKNNNQAKSQPLLWWHDLKFGKSLSELDSGHPVEYAKDKGAILNSIHYNRNDSVRELEVVMTTPDYEAKPFLDEISEEAVDQEYIKTSSKEGPTYMRFPIRLCPKEKEQKIEARLFGVAPTEFKHKLSEYMTKCKTILSYFDCQIMTTSDELRQKKMHDMSQLLLQEDVYAVMMDIEGHNQSMQKDNTYELLEWMGSLYGESGWGKLSLIFQNSEVYHFGDYTDEVLISRGQHGGIEGYMNPVWTLVTCQQLKLLKETTNLDILDISTYSDDCVVVLRMIHGNQLEITRTLSTIEVELKRLGFLCKPSQTGVSANRYTMLRQHFSLGMRSDTTLKKLLSLTICGEQKIDCTSIEIASISATASSAIESSYHLCAVTFMKWYKSILASLPVLTMLLDRPREDSLLSKSNLPPLTYSQLYNTSRFTDDFLNLTEAQKESQMKDQVNFLTGRITRAQAINSPTTWYTYVQDSTLDQLYRTRVRDTIMRLLTTDTLIREILFTLLLLPTSLGGFGLELLKSQAISGHSDATFRSLYYIHQIIKDTLENKIYLWALLKNSMKFYLPKAIEGKETRTTVSNNKLINSNWILNSHIHTANGLLKSKLVSVMRAKTQNVRLLRVLRSYDDAPILADNLVNVLKENYDSRIASFFYENSSISMVNYLLKKLESSTSLIKNIKDLDKFRRQMTTIDRDNVLSLMKTDGISFGSINDNTNMLQYLIDRRESLAPDIKFSNIEEPLYDHMLTVVSPEDAIFTASPQNPFIYSSGYPAYRQGLHQSHTLYKGEISDEEQILSAREEMLVSKLVSVTLWMILRSEEQLSQEPEEWDYDFAIACDLALSTMTEKRFITLSNHVPLNLGGEILHRLPNQKFKNKVAIRVMPNSTQTTKVSIDNRVVNDLQLKDSNINFEFIRQMILLQRSIRQHYKLADPPLETYSLFYRYGVEDVRKYRPRVIRGKRTIMASAAYKTYANRIALDRLSLTSMAYLYADNIEDVLNVLDSISIESVRKFTDLKMDNIIFDYYQGLDREMLLLDIDLSSNELWDPLYQKLRQMFKHLSNYTDNELNEVIDSVVGMRLKEVATAQSHAERNHRMVQSMSRFRDIGCEFSEHYILLTGVLNATRRTDAIITEETKIRYRQSKLPSIYKLLSLDIFFDIALGIGLETRLYEGQLVINESLTYQKTLFICSHPTQYPELASYIVDCLIIVGLERWQKIVIKKKSSLIARLKKISDECTEVYLPESNTNYTYPVSHIKSSIMNHPPEIDNVTYHMTSISNTSLTTLNQLTRILKITREISTMYGDHLSNYSMTGSDSYVGQLGAARAVLTQQHHLFDEEWVFLTAGRGDSVGVAHNLGLQAVHYSKPGSFNNTLSMPQVKNDLDYDICQPKDIPFDLYSKVIFIDVSHFKGNQRGFEDLILELLDNNSKVIIRVNSLDNFSEVTVRMLDSLGIACQLMYCVSSDLIPYQVYIFLEKSIPVLSEVINNWASSTTGKALLSHYLRQVDKGRLYSASNQLISNSASLLISVDDDPQDMISYLYDESVGLERIQSLKILLRDYILPTKMMITERMKKFIEFRSKTTVICREDYSRESVFSDAQPEEFGYTSQDGYANWERSYHEGQNQPPIQYSINLHNLTRDQLYLLSKCHPLRVVRGKVFNLAQLLGEGVDYRNASYNTLEIALDEVISNAPRARSKYSKNIKTCIAILLVASTIPSYEWAINLCLTSRFDDKIVKIECRERLEVIRKISYLYSKFLSPVYQNRLTDKVIDRLKKTFIEPVIRLKRRYLRRILNGDKAREVDDNIHAKRSQRQDLDSDEFRDMLVDQIVNLEFDLLPTVEIMTRGLSQSVNIAQSSTISNPFEVTNRDDIILIGDSGIDLAGQFSMYLDFGSTTEAFKKALDDYDELHKGENWMEVENVGLDDLWGEELGDD